MNGLLFIVPLLITLSGIILYRFNGRKEILKFDLVQFLYSFVILPIFFIWFKTFLYFLFKKQLGAHFSAGNLLAIDTMFSTFFMYIYAFIVIHSLTKSFELKRKSDPLHDLLEHSEYFHMWLSHFVIYSGMMIFVSLLSFTNVVVPFSFSMSPAVFTFILLTAAVVGFGSFCSFFLYQTEQSFFRIMKIMYGLFFLLHIGVYFWFVPTFSSAHIFYWYIFIVFSALIICSMVVQRSARAKSLLNRLKYKTALRIVPQS